VGEKGSIRHHNFRFRGKKPLLDNLPGEKDPKERKPQDGMGRQGKWAEKKGWGRRGDAGGIKVATGPNLGWGSQTPRVEEIKGTEGGLGGIIYPAPSKTARLISLVNISMLIAVRGRGGCRGGHSFDIIN